MQCVGGGISLVMRFICVLDYNLGTYTDRDSVLA